MYICNLAFLSLLLGLQLCCCVLYIYMYFLFFSLSVIARCFVSFILVQFFVTSVFMLQF